MSYLPPKPRYSARWAGGKSPGSEAFPLLSTAVSSPRLSRAYPPALPRGNGADLPRKPAAAASPLTGQRLPLHTGDVAVILLRADPRHRGKAGGRDVLAIATSCSASLLEPPDSETYRRFLAPLADGRMEVPAHKLKRQPPG